MAADESSAQGPVAVPVEATQAAARLRAALEESGFDVERDFEACRAQVTTSGQGFVKTGRLTVSTADRLSEVLEAAALAARTRLEHAGDRITRGTPGDEERELVGRLSRDPADEERELVGRLPSREDEC